MLQQFKKGFLLLAVVAAFASCQNSNARDEARQAVENGGGVQPIEASPSLAPTPGVPSGPAAKMTFKEVRYNFGEVKEGTKVTHVFKFVNDSKEPLVIADAKSTCGCTVPEWPKSAIAPGKSGEIKVIFDSSHKNGGQSKRVTIVANTNPPETFIYLEGEVKGSENPADAAAH
jgi:hypothetical protein